MNKKPYTMYLSLLPLFILIGIILGAGYFLMKDDLKFSALFKQGPQLRRIQGFPVTINTTPESAIEKQRHIITNEQQLQDFLKIVDPQGTVTPPNINFDKEYLLGVSTDTRSLKDTKIGIRKLSEDKEEKKLIAHIRNTVLDEKVCPIEEGYNLPFDLVAISKTDLKISFEAEKYVLTDCSEF